MISVGRATRHPHSERMRGTPREAVFAIGSSLPSAAPPTTRHPERCVNASAYIGGNLLVNVNAEQPELDPLATDDGNAIYELGFDDPTANLFSPAAIDKGSTLSQLITDGITDIITGRADMSKLDQIISDWQGRGGGEVRGEYEDAYAANPG